MHKEQRSVIAQVNVITVLIVTRPTCTRNSGQLLHRSTSSLYSSSLSLHAQGTVVSYCTGQRHHCTHRHSPYMHKEQWSVIAQVYVITVLIVTLPTCTRNSGQLLDRSKSSLYSSSLSLHAQGTAVSYWTGQRHHCTHRHSPYMHKEQWSVIAQVNIITVLIVTLPTCTRNSGQLLDRSKSSLYSSSLSLHAQGTVVSYCTGHRHHCTHRHSPYMHKEQWSVIAQVIVITVLIVTLPTCTRNSGQLLDRSTSSLYSSSLSLDAQGTVVSYCTGQRHHCTHRHSPYMHKEQRSVIGQVNVITVLIITLPTCTRNSGQLLHRSTSSLYSSSLSLQGTAVSYWTGQRNHCTHRHSPYMHKEQWSVIAQVNVITVLIVTLPTCTKNSGQLLDRSTSSLYSSSLSLHAQGTVISYWTGQRHHCTHRHSPYMHKEQWSVIGQVNVITVLIVTLPTRNSGQLLHRSTSSLYSSSLSLHAQGTVVSYWTGQRHHCTHRHSPYKEQWSVIAQVNVITVLIVTLPTCTRNSGQLLDRSTSSLYSSSLSLQGTAVSYCTGQRHHCTHRHSPYMHKEQWSVIGQVNVITVLIVTLPTRNSGQLLHRSTSSLYSSSLSLHAQGTVVSYCTGQRHHCTHRHSPYMHKEQWSVTGQVNVITVLIVTLSTCTRNSGQLLHRSTSSLYSSSLSLHAQGTVVSYCTGQRHHCTHRHSPYMHKEQWSVIGQVNVITVLIVTLSTCTRNSGQLLHRSTSLLYSSSLSLHAQGTVVSYCTGQRHHCTHRHSPYMHKEQWSVIGQVNVITVLIVTLPTRNSGQLLDRSTSSLYSSSLSLQGTVVSYWTGQRHHCTHRHSPYMHKEQWSVIAQVNVITVLIVTLPRCTRNSGQLLDRSTSSLYSSSLSLQGTVVSYWTGQRHHCTHRHSPYKEQWSVIGQVNVITVLIVTLPTCTRNSGQLLDRSTSSLYSSSLSLDAR